MADQIIPPEEVAAKLMDFFESNSNRILLYDRASGDISTRSKVAHFFLRTVRGLVYAIAKIAPKRWLEWADAKLQLEKNIKEFIVSIHIPENNETKPLVSSKQEYYTVKEVKDIIKQVYIHSDTDDLSDGVTLFFRKITEAPSPDTKVVSAEKKAGTVSAVASSSSNKKVSSATRVSFGTDDSVPKEEVDSTLPQIKEKHGIKVADIKNKITTIFSNKGVADKNAIK